MTEETEGDRVEKIDFYELLGDDYMFWGFHMHDDTGFGRYSNWERPLRWPDKHWKARSRDLYFALMAKYGPKPPVGECSGHHGLAAYMRRRCLRAKSEQEKQSHYWS